MPLEHGGFPVRFGNGLKLNHSKSLCSNRTAYQPTERMERMVRTDKSTQSSRIKPIQDGQQRQVEGKQLKRDNHPVRIRRIDEEHDGKGDQQGNRLDYKHFLQIPKQQTAADLLERIAQIIVNGKMCRLY